MDNHYDDLMKLTELLKKLVDSYRLLIGSASELNGINKRRTRDVDGALDRINVVGNLIDDLIEVIEGYEENYIKFSKIKNKVVGLNNEKSKVKEEFESVIQTEINNELNFQNEKIRDEKEE